MLLIYLASHNLLHSRCSNSGIVFYVFLSAIFSIEWDMIFCILPAFA